MLLHVEELATLVHVEDLATPAHAVVQAILASRTRYLRDVAKYQDKHVVLSPPNPARMFLSRSVDQCPDRLRQLLPKMFVNQFPDNSANLCPRQCQDRSVNKCLASSADGL